MTARPPKSHKSNFVPLGPGLYKPGFLFGCPQARYASAYRLDIPTNQEMPAADRQSSISPCPRQGPKAVLTDFQIDFLNIQVEKNFFQIEIK